NKLLYFGHLSILLLSFHGFANSNIDSLFQKEIQYYNLELETTNNYYDSKLGTINTQLNQLNRIMSTDEVNVKLLYQKVMLLEQKSQLEDQYGVELTKTRYKKGLAIIKLIYEKLLDLDHHFSTLRTQQTISNLTNPNSYPEFRDTKKLLEQKAAGGKQGIPLQLPAILQSNPYISTTYSLLSSFLGARSNRSSASDKESLDEISCIMDFTVRMHSDLNTIYYETEYLKEGNKTVKEECISLFEEYVEVVNYHTPLPICRNEDDWDKIHESLNSITTKIVEDIEAGVNAPNSSAYKKQVDLEFSVDRLLTFINNYTTLISQGEKYYQKFEKILSNYSNEATCMQQLSTQYEYTDIKMDVQNSIRKFKEAYNISELRGSKLKSLLYGYEN
ncbi:MAG: hypothetical protein AAFP82_06910, partial [Bacteroidota bacterium]